MSSVQPNYRQSLDFLRKFHPNRRWVLTAISTDKKEIQTRTFDAARDKECLDWLVAQGLSRNIYFSVAEISVDVMKKAERTDISRVHYLHVDIDPRAGENIDEERKRALKLLMSPPGGLPQPTFIVFSGGGYQGFWQLETPIEINNDLAKAEDAKRYNLQIEILYGADNVHNVDRIMRLPGTINRPDPVKLKKGRVEALAELTDYTATNVWPLAKFTKAPEVQAGTGGGFASTPNGKGGGVQVQVSGNVKRFNDVSELDRLTTNCKVVIVQGLDPDYPNKFPGRSETLFWVCCEMARAEYTDDEIYSVITDPSFGISASVLDKGSLTEKYAIRQIARAREEAVDPWLRDLNERFAVISNWSGKCRVVEEQYDETLKRYRLTKQTFEDFTNRFMQHKIDMGTNAKGDPVRKPVGRWWLEHEKRRQYDKIVFAPGQEVPNAYNLWRGFACEARPGDCSLFLTHVRDNICQGNVEYFNYLMGWMARGVQTPDSPGFSSIVFRGGQGTGKSFVAKTYGSLFGRHYMQVTDPKHLVGSFNSHLRDCVALFADEAFYAGDKKHESILKMLITEEMITVEAKGVDAEVAGNCIHLFMASNEAWVVPAGMDDRRFFVLDVGEAFKNKGHLFEAINVQLNTGGREALLHHLLTYDLKGFNVRNVPKTAALQQQKLFSMQPKETWWYEKLRDGRLVAEHSDWRNNVTIYDIENDYLDYCRRFGVGRRGSSYEFRTLLEKFLPPTFPVKYQTNSPIEATAPDGTRKTYPRPYWYRFPSLEICRKHWDEKYGGPYEWQTIKVEQTLGNEPPPSPF